MSRSEREAGRIGIIYSIRGSYCSPEYSQVSCKRNQAFQRVSDVRFYWCLLDARTSAFIIHNSQGDFVAGQVDGGMVDEAPSAPKLIKAPPLKYPRSKHEGTVRRDGWVRLRFTVGADGKATDVVADDYKGKRFVEYAIRHVRRCLFEPGEWAGRPVATPGVKMRVVFER